MAHIDHHPDALSAAAGSDDTGLADTPARDPRHPQAVSILLLAAAPLLLWLVRGDGVSVLSGLMCLGLFIGSLWMLADGLQVEDDYNRATAALRPRVPRKFIGAVGLGVTVAFMAAAKGTVLLPPLAFGVLAAALAVLSFGIDPLRNKGNPRRATPRPADGAAPENADARTAPTASLDLGEQVLGAVLRRINALHDEELTAAAEEFCDESRHILRLLRKNTKAQHDMAPAIDTLLQSAAAATDAFVPRYTKLGDPQDREDFLDTLDAIFADFDTAAEAVLPDRQAYAELDVEGLMARMALETHD